MEQTPSSTKPKRANEDSDDQTETPHPKRQATDTTMPNALTIDPGATIWKSITLDAFDVKALYKYIRSKGSLDIANNEGYGLLYLAARNQSMEALRILLLQPTIDVNQTHGPDRELALHAAAAAGQVDATEILLEHESDINARDALGHTPLTNSLFSRSLECLQLLLEAGASLEIDDPKGSTLLHFAAINNFAKGVQELLKHGAQVDAKNDRQLSALAVAIGMGHTEVMQSLIVDGKADMNDKTRFGTVLHHAVLWNRIDAVHALINHGCNVNVVNVMEETPLLVAVQQRKIDMVRYLIQNGADPCYPETEPGLNVPLLYAANHGYTEMCGLLITDATMDYVIQQAIAMSERASQANTAQFLQGKLNERAEKEKADESIAPSSSEILGESDFNALINTFSDDEDQNNTS
ncbi:ankyrin repeat-containing domain protein [Zychaea mexicana]|uniref:ankyrin repeat-containing domain protein n=1 Tax=Zychaea mexicana TaxID=64656 RepID=UPI0022FEB527|nr:ankyrin repeat-containing domain protein [Zychaea mexicana]KAI9490889.1 ankyrin repeat-containing domain protein [Zychaea mexicana]